MDIILAGTGETVDLPILVFGLALLFGLLFLVLWFPAWRRRRLEEKREAEYMQAYMENAAMEAANAAEGTESEPTDTETGESYHKSP